MLISNGFLFLIKVLKLLLKFITIYLLSSCRTISRRRQWTTMVYTTLVRSTTYSFRKRTCTTCRVAKSSHRTRTIASRPNSLSRHNNRRLHLTCINRCRRSCHHSHNRCRRQPVKYQILCWQVGVSRLTWGTTSLRNCASVPQAYSVG
jgi:hypothetical protein